MLTNRSMPRATVIPTLAYPDVGAAVDWLRAAFGFTPRLLIGEHRAQLQVGEDGAVVLTKARVEAAKGERVHGVMVRVADVDAHYSRALAHGAWVVGPPEDQPYGERQYTAIDLAGHAWTFSQSTADVHPADWGGTLA